MNHPLRIISFGEVLFDVFEDGAHLGGAPLNLAVHLHRLGARVQLISAVGQDELGNRAIRQIEQEGLSTSSIARVSQPTGEVTITLDQAKIPSYQFLSDCAYDFIPEPNMQFQNTDLFCFGTLAQRGDASRNTLISLISKMTCRIFCDVNLRQNFYSREILQSSLDAADLVKLNEEELPIIASLLGIAPDCEKLAEQFCLETVILTLGPKGCEIHHKGQHFSSPAYPVQIVSTVGAGDAFSAGFLYSMLSGDSPEKAAAKGNQLAAEVASIPGAF